MKITGVLTARENHSQPGVTGVARVDRRVSQLLQRVSAGDIAVLDLVDLDRNTADALVSAEVVGVVNASPSISGRFPNLGPEILVGAGIPLIDSVGQDVHRQIKEGTKLRLHDGVLYAGDKEIGRGHQQTAESVADQMIEAKAAMSAQLEAFSANTIEFLRRERTLILDGVGVPDVPDVNFEHRQAVVVAGGRGNLEDLKALKGYIAEYRPVLIGVDDGALALLTAGYTPDIIVADPARMELSTIKCGSQLVVPAHPDGHAPGLNRVREMGARAVTFPALANPEDLALLLADSHGSTLVVTVGFEASLHEFLDRGRSGTNPSTFLTRLRLGSKLIDGKAVATLHRSKLSTPLAWLMVGSAALVVLAVLVFSGIGSAYLSVAWQGMVEAGLWIKGLFV
ncbi:thiamine pyrophosphokinase [Pseudonocardiaceae bacterium YIM PH 21723]|nr:thiamine pyrophosphokinase [Pseudonocardiaceae bacterium YIM PH 21723]